jgi:hypothetical protein
MPSTFSDLKIELIATGEQSGTWGSTTNNNLGIALEEAIVGRANADFASDADLTLTLTNTNATQIARHYILNVTSAVSLSTTRNLIVPTIDKPYIVENNTTGAQSIVVKTSAGTGVTVPNGKTMMVYANSTNVVSAFNNLASGTTIAGSTIGSGDVTGPASSTDNAVARFDSTTGKLIQNSAVTIADTTGDITGGKYNGLTVSTTTGTFTLTNAKTLAVQNTLTLAGTDSTTMTFPTTSATVARTDAGQTFTGAQVVQAAATQDAIQLSGRAGGTSAYSVTLTPSTLSASRTATLPDGGGNYTLGYLNIPQSGSAKTSAYVLATGDVGQTIQIDTGGSIEIPDATFSAGDAVLLFNNTTAGITITCTITTAYIAGTDVDKATLTLATRGIASILFISGTVCVVTGNVS